MAKQTFRVFAVWRALHEVLVAVGWPVHPVTAQPPQIVFGDSNAVLNEAVIVSLIPQDRAISEWMTYGAPSQDETFTLQIGIGTNVPGMDVDMVVDRIEVLCDVVQTALRDQGSGQPAGGFATSVPGVLWWRVSPLNPQVYATTEGYGAWAELGVAFRVRI